MDPQQAAECTTLFRVADWEVEGYARQSFIEMMKDTWDMNEKILGVIDNTEGKPKGRWMKKWALVFTDRRLVVSKISGTLGVALSAMGGVLGDVARADVRSKVEERSEEAKTVSVEEILKADKENFAIPYEEIQTVEMKKGGLLSATSFSFHTEEKKYTFNLKEKKRFREYAEMVKKILPNKVS